MVIRINDVDIELNFGVKFVFNIDEKYNTPGAGKSKYGLGITILVSKILDGDITALAELLYEGTWNEKKRPSMDAVCSYLDGADDIDAVFEEAVETLKKWNATKSRAQKAAAAWVETQTELLKRSSKV